MDIRKLQRVIVDGLEDVKAQDIVVFNTEHLSSLFERVIIASGTSNRQTKSLAASVRDAVKAAGAPPPRTEGEANGEWIIVDCGAAVVHVMQPAIREYYYLEELWGEKPVRMKVAEVAPKRLVKAEAAPSKRTSAPRRSAAPAKRSAASAKPSAAPAKTRAAPVKNRAAPAKNLGAPAKTRAAPAKTRAAPAKTAARSLKTRAPAAKTAPRKSAPVRRIVSTVGVKKAAPRPAAKKAAR